MGKEERKIQFTGPLYRRMEFRADTLNEDDRTVDLSFSSEEPVDRGFGREILDHAPGSVRLKRLQESGPLLFNHDMDAHIGRVETVSIENGRGTAKVRFSKSQIGQDKLQDVRDGILREVSVGYRIHAMRLEESEEETDTYRVNDWEPLEISLVTIPADGTVGVGRNLSTEPFEATIHNTNERTNMSDTQENKPDAPIVDLVSERRKAVESERKRAADVARAVTFCAEKRGLEIPADLREKADADAFDYNRTVAYILDHQPERTTDTKVIDELQRNEKRTFSMSRLIGGMIRGKVDGFEAEVIAEYGKRSGIKSQEGGTIIPLEVLSQRSMLAGGFDVGGSTVPVQTGPMIQKLDPVPVVESAGATMLRGITSPVSFPRQTSAAVAQWVAEAAQVDASTPGTDDVLLTPHGLAAYVEFSRQLALTSSIDIESFVRGEILKRLNLAIDKAALTGPGTQGVPKGVFQLNTSTSGINTVAFGAAPTWKKLLEFEGAIEADDALMGNLSWITSSPVKSAWKGTSKDTGSGIFLAQGNEANGYPIYVTSQLAGTDFANRVVYGNFNDMLVAMYGAIELLVDSSAALQRRGLVGVTGLAHADVAFRHPESFAVSTDTGNQ